jgi:hypothetical protein
MSFLLQQRQMIHRRAVAIVRARSLRGRLFRKRAMADRKAARTGQFRALLTITSIGTALGRTAFLIDEYRARLLLRVPGGVRARLYPGIRTLAKQVSPLDSTAAPQTQDRHDTTAHSRRGHRIYRHRLCAGMVGTMILRHTSKSVVFGRLSSLEENSKANAVKAKRAESFAVEILRPRASNIWQVPW